MTGPTAEKPSSSLFQGLLRSLYPAEGYEGVIPPEQLDAERRMAFTRAGLSLMGSGGGHVQGTDPGFSAHLAEALNPDAWSQRLSNVAQSSVQLHQMQQKAQQQEQADAILRQFTAPPGETDVQRDQRLLAMANAFQSRGMMEYAKAAADLRSSLRAPPLGEKDGILYDPRTGAVVGQLPTALRTVEGSQLYAQAVARLKPWDDIRRSVTQYNQFRSAPLDQASSVALTTAARQLLDTSMLLSQNLGDPKALEHLPVVGQLVKVLGALGGGEAMTEPQRAELLKAVDPIIARLSEEHERVLGDVQRIFHEKWKDAGEFNSMWNLLPQSPSFNASGVKIPPVVQQMNDDRR